MKGVFAMKNMNKTTAVVLTLLLTLVVLGTFVSIVTGWFNPVVKVTGLLLGYLMFLDLSMICGLMAGDYKA